MNRIIPALAVLLILGPSCRPRVKTAPPPDSERAANAPARSEHAAPPLPERTAGVAAGYAIQVGVFSSRDNALRLAAYLDDRGIAVRVSDPEAGFTKVRIEGFPTRPEAESRAAALLEKSVIDEYFVVPLRAPAAAASAAPPGREEALRSGLVETARSFLDYPYAWGGTSAKEGFDCSGLAMTVYRLNGLELPRSLWDQFESGRSVDRERLAAGDLVFFSTGGDGRPSHVGIFVGEGGFIHAPGTNKTIREDSLSNPYFAQRFVGARSYF